MKDLDVRGRTARPIIDAGPALNFLGANKERLLFSVLGAISTPETVRDEILRKARSRDRRFIAVERTWTKIPPSLFTVLSDDETRELNAAVHRLSRLPLAERRMRAKDLGETMVVAHAAVRAEAGLDVTVIVDDGDGAHMATAEKRRLERLRVQGERVGSIILINTLTVLERAAGGEYVPDRRSMRETYQRLRRLDDGLLPIEQTGLLGPRLWN